MNYRKQSSLQKVSLKKRKRLITFFVFLAFSSLMWLLIKLSNVYSYSFDIQIKITELPAGLWINEQETKQTLKITVTSKGFTLLKLKYFESQIREMAIPLSAVPYRNQSKQTCVIQTQKIKDIVAGELNVNENEIAFYENELVFNIENVSSKKVPVVVNSNLKFKKQYGQYGGLVTIPHGVEVFGPSHIIDTIQYISTEELTLSNIDDSATVRVNLNYNNKIIRPEVQSVLVKIRGEKYTESLISLKILKPSRPQLKIFPDYVDVYFAVAVKDFGKFTSDQFLLELDTAGLNNKRQYLNVFLSRKPSEIQITRFQPEQVEYLIVKP